jgi:hypothetical protein
MFCSRERRSLGAAVALLSLLRNEGGSVRTSLAQIFNERRDHFHTFRLGEYLDPFNAAALSFIGRAQAFSSTTPPIRSRLGNWPCRSWRIYMPTLIAFGSSPH